MLTASKENLALAKRFLLLKWQERAAERGLRNKPVDLENACKFVSLFVQSVFGLEMRGYWAHQFNMLPDGSVLDLTDTVSGASAEIFHDPSFWDNPEHRASMDSCRPRVAQWVEEFKLINSKN